MKFLTEKFLSTFEAPRKLCRCLRGDLLPVLSDDLTNDGRLDVHATKKKISHARGSQYDVSHGWPSQPSHVCFAAFSAIF